MGAAVGLAFAAALAAGQQTAIRLTEVARKGTPEQVQAALRAGAKLTDRAQSGHTPLIAAAESNLDPEVIKVLVAAGARVEESNGSGYTPMIAAAGRNRNPEVLRALIAAGGRVNQANAEGYTPLMAAAGEKNLAAVIALLASGADAAARTATGWTALTYAAWSPPLTTKSMSDASAEIVRALLAAGARVNDSPSQGPATLSMAAARCANPEVIRLLLAAGSRVEGVGDTPPLIEAARANGNAGVLKALLDGGARVNARDAGGMTALMWAARNNTPKVVALLLDAGADPALKDNRGATALEMARLNSLLSGKPELKRLEAARR